MKLIATICKSSCLFFMLLVFFTACNEDSLSVDSTNLPTASNVLVKDGELFFPDIEAFRSVREFVNSFKPLLKMRLCAGSINLVSNQ